MTVELTERHKLNRQLADLQREEKTAKGRQLARILRRKALVIKRLNELGATHHEV